MDILLLFIYGLLFYLLGIVIVLFIMIIIGGFKLIYDCIKYCIVNENFVFGFINIKDETNISLNPV